MVGCHASDSGPWVLSTMILITGVSRLYINRHGLHAMMCDISLCYPYGSSPYGMVLSVTVVVQTILHIAIWYHIYEIMNYEYHDKRWRSLYFLFIFVVLAAWYEEIYNRLGKRMFWYRTRSVLSCWWRRAGPLTTSKRNKKYFAHASIRNSKRLADDWLVEQRVNTSTLLSVLKILSVLRMGTLQHSSAWCSHDRNQDSETQKFSPYKNLS